MKNLLTASDTFGTITLPKEITDKYPGGIAGGAVGKFLNIIILTLITVAGVYALFNLIMAGYAFMSAGDDPKKVAGAWSKIWQTLLGLAVAAGAFVLARIFGQLLFGDPLFLLEPKIPSI